jgi:hypothetical protein
MYLMSPKEGVDLLLIFLRATFSGDRNRINYACSTERLSMCWIMSLSVYLFLLLISS